MPRTPQDYLNNHETPEAALAAAVADVNSAHGENATARSFRRTFEPLLRELDIPTTQEGADRLREALSGTADQGDLAGLAELVQDLTGVLTDLGIDFSAPEDQIAAQLEALPTQWQEAQTIRTERDTLAREKEITALAGTAKANPQVLTDLLTRANLTGKVVGEGDAQAVHVFDKDGQDLGPLRAYAEKHQAPYVPALFPAAAQGAGASGITLNGQAGAGTGQTATPNPFAAALQGSRPAGGTATVSAFDLTPTATGGSQ